MRRVTHIALQAIGWLLDLIGIFGIPDDLATAWRVAEMIQPYVESPVSRVALLAVGTALLAAVYGRWLAHRWSGRARDAQGGRMPAKKEIRRQLVYRWRDAAYELQRRIDALPNSLEYEDQTFKDPDDIEALVHRCREYHEVGRYHDKYERRSWAYWKRRRILLVNRLLGRRSFVPAGPQFTQDGSSISSYVTHMLRRVDFLEKRWHLLD